MTPESRTWCFVLYICLTWTSCNIGNEPALTSDNLLDDSSNRHTTWLVAGQYHLTTKIYRVHNTSDVFRCRMVHVSALRMVTYLFFNLLDRRKFRSQTSDNMDRWKAEMGRVREEKKKEDQRRERERKKMQVREKVGKSRLTVFFHWFVAKHFSIGALLEVEMSKKWTPLWREPRFQVKSVKNWRSRTTFGSWDVEKVHAVVARSKFPSQNVQNTPGSEHF